MKRLFAILAIVTVAGAAQALTLKEKKQYAAWQQELKESSNAASIKTDCGYSIPVTLDEKFVTPFMEANTSASAYCDSALSAISRLCKDETSKAEVTKKIKKLNCKLGQGKDVKLALSGGTLDFTVGKDSANLDDVVKDWLENHL